MAHNEQVGELDIQADLAHEQREWALERVGWSVMALILAAALLGLFGSGPLAHAEVGPHAGPLWIQYNRFERRLSPSALTLHIAPAALDAGAVRVHLGADYARAINVVSAIPAPTSQELGDDAVILVFAATSLQGPAQIELQINPEAIGNIHARIGLEGAPPLTFTQFVYP